MHMPKAAIDINGSLILGQYNVRLSRIPFIIFSEPEAISMKKISDYDLRLGILAPDMRHIHTANFFTMIISHFYPSITQDVRQ